MMDSRCGPTWGKLTQIFDMLQVQNINLLLQLNVHSSVHYKQFSVHSSLRYTQLTLHSSVRYKQLTVHSTVGYTQLTVHSSVRYTQLTVHRSVCYTQLTVHISVLYTQLNVHSSVRYTHSNSTHFQKFCVLQPNIKSKLFIKLLHSQLKESKAWNIRRFVGIIILL